VRGRIGALIKLGAGFHPDLTGRENVYLNGSILGLRKDEIDQLYDDIVQFAELEPFMDTPVKRYSSGMYVRLGFAVAVHIDPEILLVDEILSVGDVSFQSRCLNRIGEIRESGATVVFVSHNMHHIASFCDRVVYLDHGIIKAQGDPGEVLARYTSDLMQRRADELEKDGRDFAQVNGSGRLVIKNVDFLDPLGAKVEVIQNGDPLTLRVHYETNDKIEDPVLDVVMRDASRGNMFQATNRDFGIEFGRMGPSGFIDVHFRSIPSNNQVLDFFLAFWNSSHTEKLDWKRFIKLHVVGNPTTSGRFLFDCDWVKVVEDHSEVKTV
jgi:ABC-type multidrug transport system ATPase subunit